MGDGDEKNDESPLQYETESDESDTEVPFDVEKEKTVISSENKKCFGSTASSHAEFCGKWERSDVSCGRTSSRKLEFSTKNDVHTGHSAVAASGGGSQVRQRGGANPQQALFEDWNIDEQQCSDWDTSSDSLIKNQTERCISISSSSSSSSLSSSSLSKQKTASSTGYHGAVDYCDCVTLVDAEGFEHTVPKVVAFECEMIQSMCAEAHFSEGTKQVVRFPTISHAHLKKVIEFLNFRHRWINNSNALPEFDIPEDMALDLLLVSNYLGLNTTP